MFQSVNLSTSPMVDNQLARVTGLITHCLSILLSPILDDAVTGQAEPWEPVRYGLAFQNFQLNMEVPGSGSCSQAWPRKC